MGVRSEVILSRIKAYQFRDLVSVKSLIENWPAVEDDYQCRREIPTPLKLFNGLVIRYGWLDPAPHVLREIFVDNTYTDDGFYIPQAGDIILDVGANIGLFALFLSTMCKDMVVHCFEPSPACLRLQENITVNALSERVFAHRYALFDSASTRFLNEALFTGSRSFFRAPNSVIGRGAFVRTITLNDALALVKARELSLLKLDIEGAEIEVLEGADCVDWSRIKRVCLEYHDFLRPNCSERVIHALKQHGYAIRSVSRAPMFAGTAGIIKACRPPVHS